MCSLVVAIAAIACAYCIVQLPFSIYYAIRQKRLINNGFLPEFDFYGDKVCFFLTLKHKNHQIKINFKDKNNNQF